MVIENVMDRVVGTIGRARASLLNKDLEKIKRAHIQCKIIMDKILDIFKRNEINFMHESGEYEEMNAYILEHHYFTSFKEALRYIENIEKMVRDQQGRKLRPVNRHALQEEADFLRREWYNQAENLKFLRRYLREKRKEGNISKEIYLDIFVLLREMRKEISRYHTTFNHFWIWISEL